MRKINTIQKRENLNQIYSLDDMPGRAPAVYMVSRGDKIIQDIRFQKGPRDEEDSKSGVIATDLLEIARDQLLQLQREGLACKENNEALRHIEESLMWLNRRVEDRIERGVLGSNKE